MYKSPGNFVQLASQGTTLKAQDENYYDTLYKWLDKNQVLECR